MRTVSPAIEGRLVFLAGDIDAPVITISAPAAKAYLHPAKVKLAFGATDPYSGVASVTAKLDSKAVKNGQTIDLLKYKLGTHKLTVTAKDKAGNMATTTTTFTIKATTSSTITSVNRLYADHRIKSRAVRDRLLGYLHGREDLPEARAGRPPAIMSLAFFTMTVGAGDLPHHHARPRARS